MNENDIETDIGAIQGIFFFQQIAPISYEYKEHYTESQKTWFKAWLYLSFPRPHFPHIAC